MDMSFEASRAATRSRSPAEGLREQRNKYRKTKLTIVPRSALGRMSVERIRITNAVGQL